VTSVGVQARLPAGLAAPRQAIHDGHFPPRQTRRIQERNVDAVDSPYTATTPAPADAGAAADRAALIADLRSGVPEGDVLRGAAVALLTGFDGGTLAGPQGCLRRFVVYGFDAAGQPRMTLDYAALYDAAAEAANAAVPLTARAAVQLACGLVTGQPLPHLRYAASVWSRADAAVILGGMATVLGFTGDSPDAVVPHLMAEVAEYADTAERLRTLCRPEGEVPGAGAALMREADEPTGRAGQLVLGPVWAVLTDDVRAVLDGQPVPADAAPAREALLRGVAVVDVHPTAGPAVAGG
jgi:hypothetical protein